jgi:hypothetical protein
LNYLFLKSGFDFFFEFNFLPPSGTTTAAPAGGLRHLLVKQRAHRAVLRFEELAECGRSLGVAWQYPDEFVRQIVKHLADRLQIVTQVRKSKKLEQWFGSLWSLRHQQSSS